MMTQPRKKDIKGTVRIFFFFSPKSGSVKFAVMASLAPEWSVRLPENS